MFLPNKAIIKQLTLSLLLLAPIAVGNPSSARTNPKCRAVSGQALELLYKADTNFAKRAFNIADNLYAHSLKTLGNAYIDERALDDTDMHLVVADIQKQKGKLKSAGSLRRRILIERLGMCGISSERLRPPN